MARTYAKANGCKGLAQSFPDHLFKQLSDKADGYNTGDLNADFIAATHDMMREKQNIVDAIRGQIQVKLAVIKNPDSGSGVDIPTGTTFSDGTDAANWLSRNGSSPFVRLIASKITGALGGVKVVLVSDVSILHPELQDHFAKNARGMYVVDFNTVYVLDKYNTEDVWLHELLHAAVTAKLADPAIRAEVAALAKRVTQSLDTAPTGQWPINDRDTLLLHKFFQDKNIFGDPDEFMAYALTSPSFQTLLSQLGADGQWLRPGKVGQLVDVPKLSVMQKLVDFVRRLFGFEPKHTQEVAHALWKNKITQENNQQVFAEAQAKGKLEDTLHEFVSRLIHEDADSTSGSGVSGSDKAGANNQVKLNAKANVSYSPTAPATAQTQPAATVNDTISKLPPSVRPFVRNLTKALGTWGRKALNATVFTEDLLNRAHDIGVKAAKMYKDLANQRAAFTGAHERVVLSTISGYNDLPDRIKGKGAGTANQFLYDSTMQRKWGYQPTWLNWKVTVDPDTETAYKALGDEGMAFVDKMFQHGAETLAEKKKAVIEGATTEYNILIAHAKKTGNETEVAELEAEKIKTLKNFGSLMSISGKEPYAPIKRFGNYVIQAMSAEYRTAKEAGDVKQMRELEKKEEHYYVNFTESQADAERELDKLRATNNYDDPGYRERELAREDLYGGSKTLQAIAGMRNRVNAMADSAAAPDAEVSKKMVKLLTDLYLTQLGEDSARASEMSRRNIAGDVDMIRSFESQGLADARLLGSIVYGQPMMESINDMRKQVKEGAASTHLEKSEVFNELIARHLQALNYEPTPWANRMTKATSLWFLATSPSYYIQNATQPWMMSLPMMAAKHGYAASGSALSKAYGDIAVAVGNAKVFGQLDFDTLLATTNKALTTGEKEAIRKLLNSGRIDIGMLSELGEARVDPDGKVSRAWNKVDQGMRGMQLKLEAINRVTTALASYRLNEKEGAVAAYEYADDILQQTHGDYSSWNAPRAFNNGFGKVALQFRKYQLIQLTLMAKMLKNSFAGATAQERAIARKAFGYTMGQAFLVGGGKALPVPFVLSWLFAAAFGEGADEPPEFLVRQWIGDKDIADVLLNGSISALTGTNMASIGGFGNAMALAPFADFDLTNRKAATEYAFTLMSGPFGGLGLKAADGIGKIANGDLYGGMTSLAPKGVGSLMKAWTVAASGVTKGNGDLAMSAEEITAWDTIQQGLGFTPQRQVRRMYEGDVEFKVDRAISTDSGRIKADFKKATRDGDTDGIREARKEWEALQALKVRFKMKRSELTAADAKPQKRNEGIEEIAASY